MKLSRKHFALAIAATSALVSAQVMARSAASLSDLVGARASSGESELEARGFTHITAHGGDYNSMHSYWWHGADKNCVHVETEDGRFAAITDGTRGDCNQRGSGAGVAAAAIGVALFAALASHKSGHHDNNQHYASDVDEQQYERGYNDGVHNVAYHNYDRSDAYSRGYEAGVQQHSTNTSYRNDHMGRGGYRASVDVSDLNDARASSAGDELGRRGFANVDSFQSGNTAYTIWYRRDSSQCLQMTVAEGRVSDIRDIGTHPRCN